MVHRRKDGVGRNIDKWDLLDILIVYTLGRKVNCSESKGLSIWQLSGGETSEGVSARCEGGGGF